MKLFLDSADLKEIREALALGVLDGVTLNPKLLAHSGMPLEELVRHLDDLVQGPLCLPAWGQSAEELCEAARRLAELRDGVFVKIPLGREGVRAMQRLRDEGIRTHATLCGSASQALLAARSGAAYVSPFVGRLEERGEPGSEVVQGILEIYGNYGIVTQVMVASVRQVSQVEAAARLGAHACTMPWKVLRSLAEHPLTDWMKQDYEQEPKREP